MEKGNERERQKCERIETKPRVQNKESFRRSLIMHKNYLEANFANTKKRSQLLEQKI